MIKLKLNWFGGQGALGLTTVNHNINGTNYNVNVTGTGANWNLDERELKLLMEEIVRTGKPLTDEQILRLNVLSGDNNNIGTGAFNNVKAAMMRLVDQNAGLLGFRSDGSKDTRAGAMTGVPTNEGGQVDALNQYYQDLYSLEPGTGGAEMLSRLEQGAMNQAQQAATLADVNFQQAAMQQAQTVKAITDQVRAERMARLRAGMSEAQIANQDMQMLMTNVNTLNQNAQMLNQQRLEAQMGMNLAQDQAYQDYLAQSAQRGQIASAMAASDAGDAYQQTIRQMTTLYGNDPTKWTASQWSAISNQVTGQNQNK